MRMSSGFFASIIVTWNIIRRSFYVRHHYLRQGGLTLTDQARSAYGDKATYYDVKKDNARLEEMLKLSGGKRQVPLIVDAGKVRVGYGGS